jgi:hypothetical protein
MFAMTISLVPVPRWFPGGSRYQVPSSPYVSRGTGTTWWNHRCSTCHRPEFICPGMTEVNHAGFLGVNVTHALPPNRKARKTIQRAPQLSARFLVAANKPSVKHTRLLRIHREISESGRVSHPTGTFRNLTNKGTKNGNNEHRNT